MNDSFVFPLIILPLFFLLFIFVSAITVLVHEMGHAIPALLFTKKEVNVYLGSYGDKGQLKNLKIGRNLNIYFKKNPLKWRKGLVTHSANSLPIPKRIAITLMGPLSSLFLALISLYIVFEYDLNGFVKLLIVVFTFSALYDLRNIYPSKNPILLDNGTITYCDGYNILSLLKNGKQQSQLAIAYGFFENKKYEKALELFESLNPAMINNDILDIILVSYFNVRKYEQAKRFYEQLLTLSILGDLTGNNLCNLGLIESYLNRNDVALRYYNQSLDLDSNNIFSLSNRGYTFNLLNNYLDAIKDFDKVIELDQENVYAYANRAYSKIKLNFHEEGLIDINKSISIDSESSYAYRNLGVYYMEKGNYSEALTQFKKAFVIDPETQLVTEYIKTAEEKLRT